MTLVLRDGSTFSEICWISFMFPVAHW